MLYEKVDELHGNVNVSQRMAGGTLNYTIRMPSYSVLF